MKIENLKDLQKVIQLCRKTGVEAIEIDNVKFNLGPEPKRRAKTIGVENDFPEASIKIPQYNPVASPKVTETVADIIKTDGLTDDELLFYSASGQMTDEQQGQ